jgi:hypothetical protein
MTRAEFRNDSICLAVICTVSIILFGSSPTAGDFWNSDSSRHAMDGLFVRDFISALPIHDPMQWAISYYFRHPAIAIAYYPPFFAIVLAAFYGMFGATHCVAQAAVGCFTFLLGFSSFQIARRMMPAPAALGAALLVLGTPLTALWARQVMLDVPAYALMVTSLWLLVRHLESGAKSTLWAAAAAIVLAIYTKYNSGFVLPALATGWLAARRIAPWRDRRLMWVILASVVALVPAAVFVLKFASANAQTAFGGADNASVASLSAWSFYPASLPNQIGCVAVPFCVAGLFALAHRAQEVDGWLAASLLSWLVVGYVTFSIISLRGERHDLAVLFPLLIGAPYGLVRWFPRFGALAALLLGALTATYGIATRVPRVSGYERVAAYIAANTRAGGTVLFDGYRDGSFIFNLMTQAGRPDIAVVRADKLLLSVRFGERGRGVTQATFDAAHISQLINRVRPDYVVLQSGFWGDLKEMALFEAAVQSPSYRSVAHFVLDGDLSTQDGSGNVDVYIPSSAPLSHDGPIELLMPDLDSKLHGDAKVAPVLGGQ